MAFRTKYSYFISIMTMFGILIVASCVFCAVRNEVLNNIYLKYGFKKVKRNEIKAAMEAYMIGIQDLNSKTKS
jgi:hypothetical protein